MSFHFDYDILKVSRGVAYGSTTLKSLQNNNLPELDLLVRESIQNSADAALKQPGHAYVSVAFTTGFFDTVAFAEYMTGISDYLRTKYPVSSAEFLEIRDMHTTGLTGKTRVSELDPQDHGNFFKLIFDTGKKQLQQGAGGNWGFGKSVYYRVGSGIVIYYSRTNVDGEPTSRLIVTVIEDEHKSDGILSHLEKNPAGKGWWGIRDGDDMLPVTDERIIAAFLSCFGLKPFLPGQTGTSIIIPFIDKAALLSDVIPEAAEMELSQREVFKTTYASDFSDYLKLSIQRWYAPKLFNKALEHHGKKWIRAVVNNVVLTQEDMLPFFRTVQDLYNVALCSALQGYEVVPQAPYNCFPVNTKNYISGKNTGYLATIKVKKDLIVTNENPFSPFVLSGRFSADTGDRPIVMFAREPGMVINYMTEGLWVGNVSTIDIPDEYLLAFFLPNFKVQLKGNLPVTEYANKFLSEYLRECEASDHTEWNDPAKMQLVVAIQRNSVKQLRKELPVIDITTVDTEDSHLKSKLGRALMPVKKSPSRNGQSGEREVKVKGASIKFKAAGYSAEGLVFDYVLRFMNGCKKVNISLVIGTEAGTLASSGWAKEIGTPFPFILSSATVSSLAASSTDSTKQLREVISVNVSNPGHTQADFSIALTGGAHITCPTSVEFSHLLENPVFSGQLTITAVDNKYSFSFKAE